MREIKFRGIHKNPYGDTWVHGYYALRDGEHVIIMPHRTNYENALKENRVIPVISVAHTIDYNTLGQFTGLYDKQGEEIYEGDIVEWDEEKYVIEWTEDTARFELVGEDVIYDFDNVYPKKELEVIGNIYENSELLKEE